MNTAEERFEQIEKYLRGKMPAAEATAFEAEMAADPGLATLVRQHHMERQGQELLVERDLMAKMKAWDQETELFQKAQPRKAIVRPMTWALRIAAVFVLAAFGYWLVQENILSVDEPAPSIVKTKPEIKPRVPTVRKPSSKPPRRTSPAPVEEASDALAQQDPAPIEEMLSSPADYAALADDLYKQRDFVLPKGAKGGTVGSAAYNQALEKFQDGKYNDAVSNLKPTLNIGSDAVQQKELLALSHYESDQFDAAIPYFREVAASGQQPYAQRAEWGLVLSLLHQMPAKKPLLDRVMANILARPEHMFYSKTKNLEERLR